MSLRYETDIAQLKEQLEESSADMDKMRKDFNSKEAENSRLTEENHISKKKTEELSQMLESSRFEQKTLQVKKQTKNKLGTRCVGINQEKCFMRSSIKHPTRD